jgi:transcriptional regulator with PAS, ATPase and Fis domain
MNISGEKLDKIVDSIIDAYRGYSNKKLLSRDAKNYLLNLSFENLERLFNHVLKNEELSGKLDELVLAILHFQALNPSQKVRIPYEVQDELKVDFKKYQDIAYAAARCNKVLKEEIVGYSKAIQNVKKNVWQACFGKSLFHALNTYETIKQQNVFIVGETGVGKELCAKAIQTAAFWHNPSKNESAPSKALNLTAYPESVIDSELFGYKKGSFTGAKYDKAGLIRTAHNGTIFLDEIGDLSPTIQVKLLRAIQERKILPIGSNREEEADVRYISATNKNVISDELFRQDFYERLAGITITIPPLRDRREDIKPICNTLITSSTIKDHINHEEKKKLIEKLVDEKHEWSGNVRQLNSAIRNFIMGIDIDDNLRRFNSLVKKSKDYFSKSCPEALLNGSWTEKELIHWYTDYVAGKNSNNVTKMSKILGIDRSTILRRRGMNKNG